MKVLITGCNGQIGQYLKEKFSIENFEVLGISRSDNCDYTCDIVNVPKMCSIIKAVSPDFFINCAAQSNVVDSFTSQEYTRRTGRCVDAILSALMETNEKARFVTLGSSELYGENKPPQNEQTPHDPKSPYGVAKKIAFDTTVDFRNQYNFFASNAICFNSESPRRSINYVSRKISSTVAKIALGKETKLIVGDTSSLRDFSHAYDTADAIYKIATASKPDDFVIASGESHSIQDFIELAFKVVDLKWQDHVEVDPSLFRSYQNNVFRGNSAKIRKELGWKSKYSFEKLVTEMVEQDLIIEGKK